jgi:hypothetical protein
VVRHGGGPRGAAANVDGYKVHEQMVNARHFGSTQNRERRISFGTRDGRALRLESQVFEPMEWDFAVTGDARRRPVAMLAGGKPKGTETGGRTSSLNRGGGTLPFEDMCELQGLPRDFLSEAPFTSTGKKQAVGNGVPLPIGRAIAKADVKAIADELHALAALVGPSRCGAAIPLAGMLDAMLREAPPSATRRSGRAKLVYNKATRLIDQVQDGVVVGSFEVPEEIG